MGRDHVIHLMASAQRRRACAASPRGNPNVTGDETGLLRSSSQTLQSRTAVKRKHREEPHAKTSGSPPFCPEAAIWGSFRRFQRVLEILSDCFQISSRWDTLKWANVKFLFLPVAREDLWLNVATRFEFCLPDRCETITITRHTTQDQNSAPKTGYTWQHEIC